MSRALSGITLSNGYANSCSPHSPNFDVEPVSLSSWEQGNSAHSQKILSYGPPGSECPHNLRKSLGLREPAIGLEPMTC